MQPNHELENRTNLRSLTLHPVHAAKDRNHPRRVRISHQEEPRAQRDLRRSCQEKLLDGNSAQCQGRLTQCRQKSFLYRYS